MDYSLLKTITPQLSYMQNTNSCIVHLTSTPARDLINPGIGQLTRLYNFYVPIHYASQNPYKVKKYDAQASKENNQEGFGQTDDVDNVLIETKDNSNEINDQTNTNLSNETFTDINNSESTSNEMPDEKMDEGVKQSFEYPKIKVGKLMISSQKRLNITKNVKKVPVKNFKNHKFHVI